MYPNKAAKALNVTKEEGKIVIDTIRSEIPVVFSMVEKASRFAMDNGYIVHNTRTNSRRWFEPVIEGHKLLARAKEERPYDIVPNLKWEKTYEEATVEDVMDFKQASECASAARNTKIQGSQADLIKEILVVFDTHVKENDWDMTLLSCIHDEICVKHPIDYHVICPFEGKRVHARHYIETLMRTVANYYLDGVEMGVEAVTEKTWTK